MPAVRTIKRQTGIKIEGENFSSLSKTLGEPEDTLRDAFRVMVSKDLVELHETPDVSDVKEISIFPGAAQRELSPIERKIAYYLLHYKPLAPTHPYIVSCTGICGGEPVIAGTRVPVRTIALYFLNGMGLKEISEEIPHLAEKEILDAFHYYLDHKEEIEHYMEENTVEKVFSKR